MDIVSRYISEDTPFVRISAPMVRYSKLPFRMLVRKHCVDLCFSAMIMADSYLQSEQARAVHLTTCSADRPLIIQLACKSAPEMLQCCEIIQEQCDGVDLNCGCPQRWAMQDGYGCALLKKPELIADLIKSARSTVPRWRNSTTTENIENDISSHSSTDVPFSVSVKIRLVPSGSRATGANSSDSNKVQSTIELIRRASSMGADWVTVHARTPSQRTQDPAEWETIRDVVAARIPHNCSSLGPLPIFLNGDVETLADAWRAYRLTGCNGIMVARGLLTNPALFDKSFEVEKYDPLNFDPANQPLASLYREWLELTSEHSSSVPFTTIHRQSYWMLEHHLNKVKRKQLHSITDVAGLYAFLNTHSPSFNNETTLSC